jgi:putative Mg2+ transporter-C (MgtC) family protein
MAGLRTNALVAMGAAGFVIFSTTVSGDNSPTRVAAQIVSGIGFLGAGVILREGINIRGLNTAATLWCAAMVGTFAGAGQLVASVLAGAFIVGTNLFLRPIVRLINLAHVHRVRRSQCRPRLARNRAVHAGCRARR